MSDVGSGMTGGASAADRGKFESSTRKNQSDQYVYHPSEKILLLVETFALDSA